MVFLLYSKGMEVMALTSINSIDAESAHSVDPLDYCVVGVLQGQVALHYIMQPVGVVFPAVRCPSFQFHQCCCSATYQRSDLLVPSLCDVACNCNSDFCLKQLLLSALYVGNEQALLSKFQIII